VIGAIHSHWWRGRRVPWGTEGIICGHSSSGPRPMPISDRHISGYRRSSEWRSFNGVGREGRSKNSKIGSRAMNVRLRIKKKTGGYKLTRAVKGGRYRRMEKAGVGRPANQKKYQNGVRGKARGKGFPGDRRTPPGRVPLAGRGGTCAEKKLLPCGS